MPILSRCYLSFAALLFLCAAAPTKTRPTPRELLDRVDDVYRGESSRAVVNMRIVTKNWSRSLKLEAFSSGKKHGLLRILSPKKEKGTATLRVEDNVWNYLPKVKRVIKLPSSMMGGSWMGSHITNDDLVKSSRMADDYTYEITFDGERDERPIIEITLLPHKDAAVVWGKVTVEMERPHYLPFRVLYYDEDMQLARTMHYGRNKKMGGRLIPTWFKVVPADEPDELTEIWYDDVQFDIKLADDVFTLRNLRR